MIKIGSPPFVKMAAGGGLMRQFHHSFHEFLAGSQSTGWKCWNSSPVVFGRGQELMVRPGKSNESGAGELFTLISNEKRKFGGSEPKNFLEPGLGRKYWCLYEKSMAISRLG